ncbi:UNVERIFIED_ORG: TetR family transcriptional regulator [Martelella mediterranea]
MAGKREAKRDALKSALITATRSLIAEGGLKGLRARDIAAKTGCALGSLYTIFDDIDTLILHVNFQTLQAIEAEMDTALAGVADDRAFEALGLAYLRFVAANRNLWAALFEHHMPEGATVPVWLGEEVATLMAKIAAPLARLMPDASQEEITDRARTFFGAVHGVIAISVENRFVGVPMETLEREIVALTGILTHGQAQGPRMGS